MTRETKYLSYLSVISCIAVVYLHTNGCFWNFSREAYWISANVIEALFYFGVPIFFMIPGATLLNYNERYGLKEYFIKRIHKTVIPFLVWTVVGLVLRLIYNHFSGAPQLSLPFIIKELIKGEIVDVYWFFPVLFCVYLSIPLLAAVPRDKKKEIFTYLAIVCFILNFVIPFIIQVSRLQISFPYYVSVGSGYLFYVIVGFLLHEYELKSSSKVVIYVLAHAGLLTHIFGTYYTSMEANEVIKTFKGYTNLPCILYSIGIFVLVKSVVNRRNQPGIESGIDRAIGTLKKYTFSIYLLHWFIKQFLERIILIDNTSILYRLFAPIVIIGISIGITFVLRKIPIMKRIVPE